MARPTSSIIALTILLVASYIHTCFCAFEYIPGEPLMLSYLTRKWECEKKNNCEFYEPPSKMKDYSHRYKCKFSREDPAKSHISILKKNKNFQIIDYVYEEEGTYAKRLWANDSDSAWESMVIVPGGSLDIRKVKIDMAADSRVDTPFTRIFILKGTSPLTYIISAILSTSKSLNQKVDASGYNANNNLSGVQAVISAFRAIQKYLIETDKLPFVNFEFHFHTFNNHFNHMHHINGVMEWEREKWIGGVIDVLRVGYRNNKKPNGLLSATSRPNDSLFFRNVGRVLNCDTKLAMLIEHNSPPSVIDEVEEMGYEGISIESQTDAKTQGIQDKYDLRDGLNFKGINRAAISLFTFLVEASRDMTLFSDDHLRIHKIPAKKPFHTFGG